MYRHLLDPDEGDVARLPAALLRIE
jgi:hypothetical protein